MKGIVGVKWGLVGEMRRWGKKGPSTENVLGAKMIPALKSVLDIKTALEGRVFGVKRVLLSKSVPGVQRVFGEKASLGRWQGEWRPGGASHRKRRRQPQAAPSGNTLTERPAYKPNSRSCKWNLTK